MVTDLMRHMNDAIVAQKDIRITLTRTRNAQVHFGIEILRPSQLGNRGSWCAFEVIWNENYPAFLHRDLN